MTNTFCIVCKTTIRSPAARCQACTIHRDRRQRQPRPGISKPVRQHIYDTHTVCHLCGLTVDEADRSIDHIVPHIKGGQDDASNLALAHRRCNYARGTRSVAEFRAYLNQS